MKDNAVLKPTEAELEIFSVLWENGPSTVRTVNDSLNKKKKVGYTTTLKIMQLMFEKKMLNRDDSRRSHMYSPAVKETETRKLLVDRFLETAFGGSAMKLVMQVLGNHEVSQEEVSRIKELLDKQ
ncbi:MAG: BlaI/MecI/CopY family transcriptional regulator [bacterium]|nr:BlaI/MecI/CopY family transcriptional regulator [bacterium]